jgi:hypothetical protein
MAARFATLPFSIGFYLAAPSGLAAAANVGGGTFAAATYFWKITGTNAAGETTGSNEATVAVAAGGTATLTWSALPAGTTGVKVYRGTVTNTENVLVATLGAVVTYTDTGTAGTVAAVPAVNSAATGGDSVLPGEQRDSASATVTGYAAAFSSTQQAAGGTVTGVMAGYLAAYPAGTVS